ncbi:hypothetical protein [Legionella maioricensis]|uniref:Uncharacterized protein n=1 Tax=Legionella maioricensis TaxID=2896528 RepID=A0A9X2D036_9GAMM|nr:hypothetical protein [Legionella maioricensis]MCL9683778.1 hypothetical protein [Legionella maioricensis]MCL9686625.1 hypothetical protein [Legionella maioricensis]
MTHIILKLAGTTARAGATARSNQAVSSVFFKPYQSPADFLYRTASVITAPLIFTGFSAFFALKAGFEVLKAIGSLLLLNTASAKENIKEAGDSLKGSVYLLVVAVVSPFINLVDLIGSGIKSVLPHSNAETEEVSPSPSYN